MKMEIKLSIVIPTLNSEDVLEETLMALLPQTVDNETVETLIINNGSTDKTQFIIDKYKQQYPLLKHIKREKTIPANENFKDGVHQANGEYVFLLGDDDILFPSFLKEILPLLYNNYGIIHFNRVLGQNNLNNNKCIYRSIDNRGCIIYDQYNSFLEEYNCEFNFMSSVVFRKDVWFKGEKFVSFDKNYYGYHWYATLLFGGIDYKCIYYSYPLVIQRVREKTWKKEWPLYWIVGMFSIYKDLDAKVPGIYNIYYKKQHDNRKDYFISLFAEIAKSKDLYRLHKEEFYSILSKRENTLYNLVLSTPYFIGNSLQKIYRLLHL